MKKYQLILLIWTIVCFAASGIAQANNNPATPEIILQEDESDEHYIFPATTNFYMDDEQNIYIIIRKETVIRKFDKNGKFLSQFGKKGRGPGEFISPMKLEFTENSIIVTEPRTKTWFTREWKYLKTAELTQSRYKPLSKEIKEGTYLDADFDWTSLTAKLFIGKSIDEIETLIEEAETEYEEKKDEKGRIYSHRWTNPFIFTLDSRKNPIYDYCNKFVIKEYINGKSGVLASNDFTKRKVIYENGKPEGSNFREYYYIIQLLALDKLDNIWVYVISNEFSGFIRFTRNGKETGRYPVVCCDSIIRQFHPFKDYLYYLILDEYEGIKILRIKL